MPQKRVVADSSAAQLHTHEAVCAERYGKIMGLLDAALYRIGRLEVLVVIVAGSMIIGMAGLITTLALKLGHAA
ncbi:MAG TPA: hypothetical protein VJ747_17290 [Stellaceae bacterium]|nr:hypothetical protein [Stellaceae bacterium]